MPSKKGLKKGLETTVIFKLGCCSANARITGTVIATSPMADNRMTAICVMVLDKVSGLFLVLIQNRIQIIIIVHLHLFVHFHEFITILYIRQ